MSDQLVLRGVLKGHSGWVTAIATTSENPDMILSASRDKSIIVWKLTRDGSSEDAEYGRPYKALKGHNHFVQDVVISSDGAFALSASWDKTLRLWDLSSGQTTRRFIGHTNVSFSCDTRFELIELLAAGGWKHWNGMGWRGKQNKEKGRPVPEMTRFQFGQPTWQACLSLRNFEITQSVNPLRLQKGLGTGWNAAFNLKNRRRTIRL